jgi:hypothetical protein
MFCLKICTFAKKIKEMEAIVETAKIKTQYNRPTKKQFYTVEEVFDRIDSKFIDFYGEYGRKIVNERRSEWNQDDIVDLKML